MDSGISTLLYADPLGLISSSRLMELNSLYLFLDKLFN